MQLRRPNLGILNLAAIAVAAGKAIRVALTVLGADLRRNLGIHDALHQHLTMCYPPLICWRQRPDNTNRPAFLIVVNHWWRRYPTRQCGCGSKNTLKPWQKQQWRIPRVNGEFVAAPVSSTGPALNTHRMASLYETFPAAEARRIVKRLKFHHTPKHASWLNMADIAFSALSRACLKRRNPDAGALQRQITAYETERNVAGVAINWRFSTQDARTKLHRIYPCLSNID